MLITLLWLSVLSVAASVPFQCYSCGVFLNAPTAFCKGEPKKLNCTGNRIRFGCISVSALNADGSYYVEKRCANSEESELLQDGECVTFSGMKSKEMRKCYCAEELCNGHSTNIHLSILNFSTALLIICLFNKALT